MKSCVGSLTIKTVAIIPARGGSKGIPQKNITDFCGKPLIAWSIEHAKAAAGVDSVWVSSDCDEILAVAAEYGAGQIHRPAAIADDHATSEDAWLHAIDWLASKDVAIDIVLGMQATSPLRDPQDIERALHDFEQQDCDSLFSAAALEDFLIWQRDDKGAYHSLNYDYQQRQRRQDRKAEYVENGSFYLFKPEILRQHSNRLGGRIGISLMDFWKSFEIDTLDDLQFCESLLRNHVQEV